MVIELVEPAKMGDVMEKTWLVMAHLVYITYEVRGDFMWIEWD